MRHALRAEGPPIILAEKPPSDEFFDKIKIRSFLGGKKAEVTHLDEPSWKNVLQEAVDELLCIQGAVFELVLFGIFVPERHPAVFNIQDVSVGDGHTEDVRSEVF